MLYVTQVKAIFDENTLEIFQLLCTRGKLATYGYYGQFELFPFQSINFFHARKFHPCKISVLEKFL